MEPDTLELMLARADNGRLPSCLAAQTADPGGGLGPDFEALLERANADVDTDASHAWDSDGYADDADDDDWSDDGADLEPDQD